MKKSFMLILTLFLLLSVSACSKPVNNSSSAEIASTTSTEENNFSTPLGTFKKKAQITETVLFDENNVKITATGLLYDSYDVEVEVLLENNTTKDLSFVCGSSGYNCNSINGYMVQDGYMFCDVAAGKKARDAVSFSYDELMLCGITEIADIELGFDIYDDDYNDIYTGPRQIKTTIADSFDYDKPYYQTNMANPAFQDAFHCSVDYFATDKLHDQDGISVLSQALVVTQNGTPMLLLEVLNASSEMVYVTAEDIAINGLVCSDSLWFSNAINPGKRLIVGIELSSILPETYWNSFGIKEIACVDITLAVEDEDGAPLTNPAILSIKMSEIAPLDASGTEVYNANGIRIVSKGIFESDTDYGDDLYVAFLAENNSGKTIWITDVYDSASVNGFMTDYSLRAIELDNGESALVEIELWDTSLERNKIASIADIAEFEIKLSLAAGNRKIDEPKLVITY